MNGSIIFWVIVILILIILWGIHIRRCCKYFDSITERGQRERRVQRRILQTVTINVRRPPYTIEEDVERGVQSSADRKIDRDLPTYEEVMEEDIRRCVNHTNISSNQPPPPPPPPRY